MHQSCVLCDSCCVLQDVGMSITLEGIGIVCNGHFDYHGLAIVSGSGDLQAVATGQIGQSRSSWDLVGLGEGILIFQVSVQKCPEHVLQVKSSSSSSATVALHGTNMAQNLPWAVEVS